MDKSRMRARGASGLICARVVMETHLGRPLTKDELVHHIDGNPGNDDISNLQILSREEHTRTHMLGKTHLHRPWTVEEKQRLREQRLGRTHTPETIALMRRKAEGRQLSMETKAKISKSHTGLVLSAETIQRRTESRLRNRTIDQMTWSKELLEEVLGGPIQ